MYIYIHIYIYTNIHKKINLYYIRKHPRIKSVFSIVVYIYIVIFAYTYIYLYIHIHEKLPTN